jgi:broad specificity phosphatase PhoE/ribonuclease HI
VRSGAPRVVVEADGGARGNPGPAGYGAVVRDADTGELLAERSASLGTTTNNVAEYSGLIAGLDAAAALGAREVDVRMDSKLVIEQMSGRWQIKHPGLRPLAAQAAALVRRFDTVRFEWVPRERNRAADALANRAMDEAAGARPKDEPPPRSLSERRPASVPQPGSSSERRPASVRQPRSLSERRPASVRQPGSLSERRPASVPQPAWEPPTGAPTRMILVRHGETELTASHRYSGRGDVPLSERGIAQARAVALRLAGTEVAGIVSSPLSRCTRTAAILAEAVRDPPVTVDDDLVECDFGEWEGLTFAEVRARWPAELDRWLADPNQAPPGGESFRAVDARVRRALTRIREQHPEGTVVVVSHVSPIKLLLRDALAAGNAFLHRMYLDPAGLSIVDYWPDGGVAVRTVNETAHLTT